MTPIVWGIRLLFGVIPMITMALGTFVFWKLYMNKKFSLLIEGLFELQGSIQVSESIYTCNPKVDVDTLSIWNRKSFPI